MVIQNERPSSATGKTTRIVIAVGGPRRLLPEPTPSPRLWATAPGATPARLCEHTMRVCKPTLKTGTFYFGGNRNFLLWSDRSALNALD